MHQARYNIIFTLSEFSSMSLFNILLCTVRKVASGYLEKSRSEYCIAAEHSCLMTSLTGMCGTVLKSSWHACADSQI